MFPVKREYLFFEIHAFFRIRYFAFLISFFKWDFAVSAVALALSPGGCATT